MNIPDVVGLIGVICYQVAYAGLQLGRFTQSDSRYIGLNILGPGCLLFSLFFYFNLASFITQVLWICLTALGLIKILRARRNQNYLAARECMENESLTPQNAVTTTRAVAVRGAHRTHTRPKAPRRARGRPRKKSGR